MTKKRLEFLAKVAKEKISSKLFWIIFLIFIYVFFYLGRGIFNYSCVPMEITIEDCNLHSGQFAFSFSKLSTEISLNQNTALNILDEVHWVFITYGEKSKKTTWINLFVNKVKNGGSIYWSYCEGHVFLLGKNFDRKYEIIAREEFGGITKIEFVEKS